MNYVADRMKCIDASGIRRIWQMAATMTDPVNFSIGEPDFGPSAPVKAAAVRAIEHGHNGYTVTAGIQPLRDKIAAQISGELGWDKPAVLITGGLSGALMLALMATVNAGDEVLIADPYFVSYRHLVNLIGGRCVFVDTYPDFELTAEQLNNAVTEKSKVLILNSPANPTGGVYSDDRLRQVAEVAGRHKLLILSDEIYREFSYDRPADSIGRYYDRALVMRGFSKTYGVPGWRLGYVAAGSALHDVLEEMTSLQQYSFVCAPHPFQLAALEALDSDISVHIEHYRCKRDLLYDGLKSSFELVRPAGAFYAFVAAPGGDATAFVAEAIRNDVLVIPGAVFSQRDSHFRISYATGDDMIRKGVDRLCRLARRG